MRLTICIIFWCISGAQILFGQKTEQDFLQSIQVEKNDTSKFNRMIDLFDYYVQNDLRKAKLQLTEIKRFSEQINYVKGSAQYFHLKGKYHLYQAEADSSIYWYRKYFKSQFVQESIPSRINALNNLGNSFNAANQLDSAFYYLNQGLELARKHHAKEICALFNNLGLVVSKQSQYKNAIHYFELAHRCFLDHGSTPATETIINLATLYSFTQDEKSAQKIQSLLKNSLQKFSRNDLATLFMNLGLMYVDSQNALQAKTYLTKADSLQRLISEKPQANILHGLAKVELLQKQPRNALSQMTFIYHHFPEYSERLILIKDLAKLNFELGNHLESKQFYEELISLKDSLYHTEIEKTIAKAQKDVDFYEKELEVKDLNLENQMIQSKRKQERNWAILGGIFLLSGIVWVGIIYRSEKTKRKLSELEIQHKNHKIQEFYEKVEQRNTIIQEIETSFQEYKDSYSIQSQLKETIIDSLELKGDRELYQLYFEDQHIGFYTALKKIAPELTNQELRLCSLTKLRMSLKESAEVLNVSVDAIKSGRYRIKKKLNLETDENLSDYLQLLNY